MDVWLDGIAVAGLSGLTTDLGTNPIGRLELGDSATARTFDVAFDNVVADAAYIAATGPPTAPTNLRTTAVTAARVDLAWDAATGGGSVASYRVYRGGTSFGTVDGSTLTYSDGAVTDATGYTYTVTALDSSGRESPISNSVSVTTPDGTPPSKPTGFTATAAGSSQVNLSWNAATDNVSVTGYRIYRGVQLAGSVDGSTLVFADTGLAPATTYTYSVAAVDAAGNESAGSDVASATTGSGPAPPPPSSTVFADGFETGDFTKWTSSSNLTIQTGTVSEGVRAAEAKSPKNTTAFAVKQLPGAYGDLYYRASVNVLNGKRDTVNLLTLSTGDGTKLLSLSYDTNRKLAYRNNVSGTTATSSATIATGVWYTLRVHLVVNGTASQVEVWVNGTRVLNGTESLGTTPIGQIIVGEWASGHAYDYAIDDVSVDTSP
jgi:chitodextrinase